MASLFVGQTLVQLLNATTGFFLLRWLSIEAMAQYGVVFGFQGTLSCLSDLGFTGCIVSLVGARGDQPHVIGAYVAAARFIRKRLFATILPLGAIAFWFIGYRQGWSLSAQVPLFACITASLYLDGAAAWYRSGLLIHQHIRDIYRIQIFAAVGKLCACLLLLKSAYLGALSLCVVNVLSSFSISECYRRLARPIVNEPDTSTGPVRREMFRYVAPIVPGMIFYALQGQVVTFLIAIFGKATNIAEVTALGRLGQLFTLLGAVNGMLIGPYFARVTGDLLARRYFQTLAAGTALAALIVGVACYFPHPLLWLLGPKYIHLQDEVGWMIFTSAMAFLGNLAWTIHSARKWVFWWATACHISFVVVTQAVFIMVTNLSSTLNVLRLNAAATVAVFLVQVMIAVAGFWKKALPAPVQPSLTPVL